LYLELVVLVSLFKVGKRLLARDVCDVRDFGQGFDLLLEAQYLTRPVVTK
jgi:hypothetical protein